MVATYSSPKEAIYHMSNQSRHANETSTKWSKYNPGEISVLNQKSHHIDDIFVTGSYWSCHTKTSSFDKILVTIDSCQNGNFRCCPSRNIRQRYNICSSSISCACQLDHHWFRCNLPSDEKIDVLTYWGRNKKTVLLHTKFSNAFSSM